MASEEKEDNISGTRSRKSNSRRSSILKIPKSPSRNILNDLDPNTGAEIEETEHTKTFGKKGRKSRRVSFAETFQVKEFVKDNGNQGVNWGNSDAATPGSSNRTSTGKCISTAGLESLLTGAIENEVGLSAISQQVNGVTQNSLVAENTSVSSSISVAGSQNVHSAEKSKDVQTHEKGKIDSRSFLKNLFGESAPEKRSGSTSIILPERKHSPIKSQNPYYETERKVDLETIVHTSVNKYLAGSRTTTSATVSPHNMDSTKVFDDPMEMTGMHTANLQFLGQKPGKPSICNATWANETTKVYGNSTWGNFDVGRTEQMDFTECVVGIAPPTSAKASKKTLNALSSTKIYDITSNADDFVFSPNLANISKIDKNTVLFDSDEEDFEMTTVNDNISMMLQSNVSIVSGSSDLVSPVKQKIDSQKFLQNIIGGSTGSRINTNNKTLNELVNMDMTKCIPQSIPDTSDARSTCNVKDASLINPRKDLKNLKASGNLVGNGDKTVFVFDNMELTTCVPSSDKTGECELSVGDLGQPESGAGMFSLQKTNYQTVMKDVTSKEATKTMLMDENMDLTKCTSITRNTCHNLTTLSKDGTDFNASASKISPTKPSVSNDDGNDQKMINLDRTCVSNSPVIKFDSRSFLSSLMGKKSSVDSNMSAAYSSEDQVTKKVQNNKTRICGTDSVQKGKGKSVETSFKITDPSYSRGDRLISETASEDMEFTEVVVAEADSSDTSCPTNESFSSSFKASQFRKGLSDITHVFNADETVADMEPTACVGCFESNEAVSTTASTVNRNDKTVLFSADDLGEFNNLGEVEETMCVGGIANSTKVANKSVCFNLEENTVHKFDIVESQHSLDHLEEMIVVAVETEKVDSLRDKTVIYDAAEGMMEETACIENVMSKLQPTVIQNKTVGFTDDSNVNVSFHDPNAVQSGFNEDQSKERSAKILFESCDKEKSCSQNNQVLFDSNKTIIYSTLNKTSSNGIEETVCVGGILNDSVGSKDPENKELNTIANNELAVTLTKSANGNLTGLTDKITTECNKPNVRSASFDKTVFFSLDQTNVGMEETTCVGGLMEKAKTNINAPLKTSISNPKEDDNIQDILDEKEPVFDDLDISIAHEVTEQDCPKTKFAADGDIYVGDNKQHEDIGESIDKTEYFHGDNTANMDFTSVVSKSPKVDTKIEEKESPKCSLTEVFVNKTKYFQHDDTAAMDFTSVVVQSPLQALKARLGKRRRSSVIATNTEIEKLKYGAKNKAGDITNPDTEEKVDRTRVFTNGDQTAFMDMTSCVTSNLEVGSQVGKFQMTFGENLDDSLPLLSTTLGLRIKPVCSYEEAVNVDSRDAKADSEYFSVPEADSTLQLLSDVNVEKECTKGSGKDNVNPSEIPEPASDTDIPVKKLRLSSNEEVLAEGSQDVKENIKEVISSSSIRASAMNKSSIGLNASTASSVCSKSILDILQPRPSYGHSFSQMSVLEDLSHYQPKSIEDHMKRFSVFFNERKVRHSTMAPVSVRPPETVSDALQQVIYEPQLETYEWACDQLNVLSKQCKEMTTDVEERLLDNLPEILKNEPGNPDTVQKIANMKALSRKKARTMFKNWKCKMLKTIGESLKQETEGLKTGVKEVSDASREVATSLELLKQVERELDENEKLHMKKREEKLTNVQAIKDKEQKKEELEVECHRLEKERTELSVENVKLQEKLLHLEEQKKEKSNKFQRQDAVTTKKIRSVLSHLKCMLYFDILKWDSDSADISLMENCLVLHIRFGQSLQNLWYKDLQHKEIRHIELVSKHAVDKEDDESLATQLGVNLVLWRVTPEILQKECRDTMSLSRLLQMISLTVIDATQLSKDVADSALSKQHYIRVNHPENEIVLVVSSLKAFIKFDLTLTIEPNNFPNKSISWRFKNYIGDVSTEDMEMMLQGVKPGFAYFKRLVQTVVKFIQEKERLQIFSK